jgi:hypothetical protein
MNANNANWLSWSSIVAGVIGFPFSFMAWRWTLFIRSFDLGNNDFWGLFCLFVELLFLSVSVPLVVLCLSLAIGGFCLPGSRVTPTVSLILGGLSVLMIVWGFYGRPRSLF